MTKKLPPVGKRFPPGVSGNPGGKPKQLLTQDKVSSVLGKFCLMTRIELQEIVQSPKSTMLEVTVASILARAAKDGDYSRLEFLLSRSIGKVTDKVEVKLPQPVVINRPSGEQVELGARMPEGDDD